MSKSGQMYAEAMEEDMGGKLGRAVKIIRHIVDNEPEVSANDAIRLGWSLHDLDSALQVIENYPGNLDVIESELDIFSSRLVKIGERMQK